VDEAEAKAAQLRSESEAQAEKLRTESEDRAELLRSGSEERAEKLRSESKEGAERVRAESEKSAAKLRSSATAAADRMRADAEADAQRTVGEADARVAELRAIESDARQRIDDLTKRLVTIAGQLGEEAQERDGVEEPPELQEADIDRTQHEESQDDLRVEVAQQDEAEPIGMESERLATGGKA